MNPEEKQIPPVEKYFYDRMAELGITDQNNTISIRQGGGVGTEELVPQPIFRKHPLGIEIMVYTLDRMYINYTPENARWKQRWSIVRLFEPVRKPNGEVMKYKMPKGNGSFPFFPPSLVLKYEDKTPIDTLFLTEGFFKAFKGHLHGVDIIGLPSITHLKDKEKGTIHGDILDIIKTCKVKRVVWLTDGDCLDISRELETDGKPKDLYRRPANFFSSIVTFKQLLDDYEVDKYFMHIDTENILGKPKGLDDLLIACPERTQEIVSDLYSVSKPGTYFQKFNITFGLSKVRSYFHLSNVDDFYLYHVERRPDLKGKPFIWNGTQYRYNEGDGKCEMEIPGDATKYFRVGDNYFKFVGIPNQYKQVERVFVDRKKGTIVDDHGKHFIKHIPKFEAFCNVPDHVNFQQYIDNCFNVYSPLEIHADDEECGPEDCPTIIGFIRHIFGDTTTQYKDATGEVVKVSTFEMGLDYVQILYQLPWEKLPVLCLVSKENATGKSSFLNLLRMMLGANVAIVGNADLAADFNAHWATKLVVGCDETKIDKHNVVEKVKMLSTAKKVMMNAKGRNQVEIDCFIKFILVTNNEDNFIYASDEDIRFWVVKVPKLKTENPTIMENFMEELPAFMSYLNKRKLSTKRENRMWFHPHLLKTEALKRVVAYSEPVAVKEIKQHLRDMFFDFEVDEIRMTRKAINKEFFNNRYEANYLEKVLRDVLKVDTYHVYDFSNKHPETGEPAKIYKTCRHSYPRWEVRSGEDGPKSVKVEVVDNGRPYIFRREQFLTPEEIAQAGTPVVSINVNGTTSEVVADDLPF